MSLAAFAVCLAAGLALGILFYGGLWMTVCRLPGSAHPVILTVGSFWLRTVITVGGFLLVMNGRWQNAVVCMFGFAGGRLAVSRFLPKCT
ncbi:MAG: ATP synthase subunit I [Bryobacteraceae bacterium]